MKTGKQGDNQKKKSVKFKNSEKKHDGASKTDYMPRSFLQTLATNQINKELHESKSDNDLATEKQTTSPLTIYAEGKLAKQLTNVVSKLKDSNLFDYLEEIAKTKSSSTNKDKKSPMQDDSQENKSNAFHGLIYLANTLITDKENNNKISSSKAKGDGGVDWLSLLDQEPDEGKKTEKEEWERSLKKNITKLPSATRNELLKEAHVDKSDWDQFLLEDAEEIKEEGRKNLDDATINKPKDNESEECRTNWNDINCNSFNKLSSTLKNIRVVSKLQKDTADFDDAEALLGYLEDKKGIGGEDNKSQDKLLGEGHGKNAEGDQLDKGVKQANHEVNNINNNVNNQISHPNNQESQNIGQGRSSDADNKKGSLFLTPIDSNYSKRTFEEVNAGKPSGEVKTGVKTRVKTSNTSKLNNQGQGQQHANPGVNVKVRTVNKGVLNAVGVSVATGTQHVSIGDSRLNTNHNHKGDGTTASKGTQKLDVSSLDIDQHNSQRRLYAVDFHPNQQNGIGCSEEQSAVIISLQCGKDFAKNNNKVKGQNDAQRQGNEQKTMKRNNFMN